METSQRKKKHLLMATLVTVLGICPLSALRAQQAAAIPPPSAAGADSAVSSDAPSEKDMADVLRVLGEMRTELRDSRQEVEDLRKEVKELRQEVAATNGTASVTALQNAVSDLQENQEVVQSQVKTLAQTKVESASKYPLKISGMILFNSFVVDGAVDNPMLPLIALPKTANYAHHSLGGSLDQTQLGLAATGPSLWGARTSADLSADFFGQVNYTSVTSANSPYFHLRTVNLNLDWDKTRISGGLQTPLVSLLSPTSFATVAEPALAWEGNLWTWLPQITIQREFDLNASSRAVLAFGLIDSTSGDVTGELTYGIMRRALQPGYEGRVSYQWGDKERPYEIGANGYYTRQLYSGSGIESPQALDFWAATGDWRVPLGKITELSGEAYRGRGIGDLGGGAFKNVVKDYSAEYFSGLDAAGGWAGLKTHLPHSLELNTYFGEDSANSNEVRSQYEVTAATSPYQYLVRNQSAAANLIFRPKSYLVFSGEYRYLRSWYIYGPSNFAQTLDLTMGYIF